MGGRCAGVACEKTPQTIFLLHWVPQLNTFSLHSLPRLVLHHELLGTGTSLWVLSATMVGSAWDAHPQNICSCASLLLLSYFLLVLGDGFISFQICKCSDSAV